MRVKCLVLVCLCLLPSTLLGGAAPAALSTAVPTVGSRLAFLTEWQATVNGVSVANISTGAAPAWLTWSEDGQFLAWIETRYVKRRNVLRSRLAVVDLLSGEVKRFAIAPAGFHEFHLTASATGYVFVDRQGFKRLDLSGGLTGARVQRVDIRPTRHAGCDFVPRTSLGDRLIVTCDPRDRGASEFFVVDADGVAQELGRDETLKDVNAAAGDVATSSDGQLIAFESGVTGGGCVGGSDVSVLNVDTWERVAPPLPDPGPKDAWLVGSVTYGMDGQLLVTALRYRSKRSVPANGVCRSRARPEAIFSLGATGWTKIADGAWWAQTGPAGELAFLELYGQYPKNPKPVLYTLRVRTANDRPRGRVYVRGAIEAAWGPAISVHDPKQAIRTVDWNSTGVPASICGGAGFVTLHGGDGLVSSALWPDAWQGGDPAVLPNQVAISVSPVVEYGDVDGDGYEDAAVSIWCTNGGGTAAGQLTNGLALFSDATGDLELLGTISTSRPTTSHVPYFSSTHIARGSVTVTERWYGPVDGTCCPTGRARTVWTYNGQGFVMGETDIIAKPKPDT